MSSWFGPCEATIRGIKSLWWTCPDKIFGKSVVWCFSKKKKNSFWMEELLFYYWGMVDCEGCCSDFFVSWLNTTISEMKEAKVIKTFQTNLVLDSLGVTRCTIMWKKILHWKKCKYVTNHHWSENVLQLLHIEFTPIFQF